MTLTVVGAGLIGGSIALDLRAIGFVDRVVGVEISPWHAQSAIDLGLVDEVLALDDAVSIADLVIVAIPVNDTARILPAILDRIEKETVVTDVGSTKKSICDAVENHPHRGRFVASHPIAGTENSGPTAALRGLFRGKPGIVCNTAQSDTDAAASVRAMYTALGMRLLEMDAADHDRHMAYVSHLSHITSFVLATTVLEIEKSTSTIFDLAGSGFESTARLAKSSPHTWTPIFLENATYILEALDAYIENLVEFKEMIGNRTASELRLTMTDANAIRRVLAGIASIPPLHHRHAAGHSQHHGFP